MNLNQEAMPGAREFERTAVAYPFIVRVAIAYAVIVALGLGMLAN